MSDRVATMLLDEFSEKRRSWRGWRAVDEAEGKAGYSAVVEVQHYRDKLDLRVELYSGAGETFETSFRESMNWTPALRELDESAAGQPVADGECGAGADPGERWLEDEGVTLADWVLLEGDRLVGGDYEVYRDVMIRAKRHLADHCGWEPVATIMEDAISGLATVLEAEIERDPRLGLARLLRIEASAGKHLKLLHLRARANELLGERREQDRAYSQWLGLAPRTPEYRDQRLAILKAKRRIHAEIAAEDDENALGLDGGKRSLVRRGLVSFGYDGGEGAAGFGALFRVALRAWQAKNERRETGYLTADQAEALMAAGRAAEKRAQDDSAFARAKAADTAAAYAEYLARYPNGRHTAEAKRRLDIARAREEEERERERALREPGRRFRDCEGSWCPEMVVVPSGSYMMGSPESEEGRNDDEGPVHRVRIAKAFAVGVHEVTFEEWDACRRAGGCRHNPDDEGWGRGRRPVINVSWKDAQEYVRWLSRETGEEYRLLSESEWEYVARAGTTTPFHFGSTISTEQANYNGNYTYGSGRKGEYRRKAVSVKSFPPNDFGLHNVHGNVWEWVEDCWHESYRGAPVDGSAWTSGGDCSRRVLRGGSWLYSPQVLRSAAGSPPGTGTTSPASALPGRWIDS